MFFSYLIFRAYHGFKDIIKNGIHFELGYLLLSFVCQMIGVALAALVWSNVVHRLRVKSSYSFDYEAFCTSAVARKIPGTVWYAIGRIFLYNIRYKVAKTLIMIAVLIEAIMISLGGLVALGINIVAGFAQVTWINPKLLFVLIPILVAITAMLGPRIIQFTINHTNKTQNNQENVEISVIKPQDTLIWIIGETFVSFLAAGVGYFLLKSIVSNASVPFTSVSGALSIAIALGPIAMWLPGDIGLKDGFLFLVLSRTIGGSLAAVVTITWRIWVTSMELALGGLTGIALNRSFKQLKLDAEIKKER
jgi:hypothetical protein